MAQHTGAQLGLLAFAVAIVAGLYAGNSTTVVLTRALLALLAGAVVGQFAGWAAKAVLRDHLQRKKLEIDRQHSEAVRALSAAAPPAADPETEPAEVG